MTASTRWPGSGTEEFSPRSSFSLFANMLTVTDCVRVCGLDVLHWSHQGLLAVACIVSTVIEMSVRPTLD